MYLQIHYEKDGQFLLVLGGYQIFMLSTSFDFFNSFWELAWIFYSISIFIIYDICQGYQISFKKSKIGSHIFKYCKKKYTPDIQGGYHIMDNKIQEFYYKHAYKVMKLQIINYMSTSSCCYAHLILF